MELLSSKIKKIQEIETLKKIPYISGNGNPKRASYISGNGTFQSTPRKFLIFQPTETSKKFLIFSQKKAVLKFQEMETSKNSLCFRKRNFLIFRETLKNFPRPKSKRTSYVSGSNMESLKIKTFLYSSL